MKSIIQYSFITAYILLLFIGCKKNASEAGPTYKEGIISEIDSLSFPEAKKTILEYQRGLHLYASFFESFKESERKNIPEEEEKYDTEFRLSDPVELETACRNYMESLQMEQEITYPSANIEISSQKKLPEYIEDPDYVVKMIYYKDGTIDSTSRSISDNWSLKNAKPIDSIRLKVTCYYPVEISKHSIKKDEKSLEYRGQKIQLTAMDKNCVYLTIPDSINKYCLKFQAANGNGKLLLSNENTRVSYSPEKGLKAIKQVAEGYDKIIEGMSNKKYNSTEDLKKAIRKHLPEMNPFIDLGETYMIRFYRGTPKEAIIYMTEKTENISLELTLKNPTSFSSNLVLFKDEKSSLYGFINTSGKIIIQPAFKDLYSINNYYFSSEDYHGEYLLRLNERLLKLDTVKGYYDVTEAGDEMLIVESKDGLKGVLDKTGNLIIPQIYEDIYFENEEKVFRVVNKDDLYGLLNIEGKELLPVKYSQIDPFHNGCSLVEYTKGKDLCFIDKHGKTVINLNAYISADAFSEGLSMVENRQGKIGYIDVNGRVAIPIIYENGNEFNNTIALVELNGKYGLINKKNEVIVPFESSGYSTTIEKGYLLNGKRYNSEGKEISISED